MIKIEFKSKTSTGYEVSLFKYVSKSQLDDFEYFTRPNDNYVDKVIPYDPSHDIWLDRSFILQQLGISKEQDEQMQHKYK